ncbi:MAG: hypothetical protein V9G04_12205 [Nocardioides sp.]
MSQRREHPIVEGLLALLVGALALALALGLGAWLVAKVAGVGGGSDARADSRDEASMYLPKPEKTGDYTAGPLISAGPGPSASESASDTGITLQSPQAEVGVLQQITLSGEYPGGDGAVLQVQRFASGSWVDFPVTANVSGGKFSTYIQTGQTGENKFRMTDKSNETSSNEITVTIG